MIIISIVVALFVFPAFYFIQYKKTVDALTVRKLDDILDGIKQDKYSFYLVRKYRARKEITIGEVKLLIRRGIYNRNLIADHRNSIKRNIYIQIYKEYIDFESWNKVDY